MSAPLRNAYVEKTATTERSCYVCMKMTVKVLTAKDGGDFFYVCASHLSDPGFAQGEGYPSVPTPEALAAVAAIRKKKAEAEKKKQEETAAAKTSTDDSQKSAASRFGSAVYSGLGTIASATASSVSAFINDEEAKQARTQEQEYQKRLAEAKKKPAYWVLDQKIFFLRQNEVKKKAAKKGATETLGGLSFPKVPKEL